MFDFFLLLMEGAYYSILLAIESVLLCMPIAILGALLLKKDSPLRKSLLFALDVFIALPNNVLLLTLAGILGGGSAALLLSVFVTQAPGLLRHLRIHFLRAYSENHVEAAQALGISHFRLFWKHVLPRLWAPLSVMTLSLMKRVILSESLLSFLGLGFDPLTPSLGKLISEGKGSLYGNPVYFLAPVVVLILCLFALQSFSDRYSSLFRTRGLRYL